MTRPTTASSISCTRVHTPFRYFLGNVLHPPLFAMNTPSRQLPGRPHSNFDDLPTELKLHILQYALTSHAPVGILDHHDWEDQDTSNFVGLLLTSKAMRALANEVYYSSNTFVIQRSYGAGPTRLGAGAGKYIFRYPPFGWGHFVRTLEMRIELPVVIANRNLELLGPSPPERARGRGALLYNDWLILLRLRASSAADDSTSWQAHFPRLDMLSVSFGVTSCFTLETRASMKGLPEHATIDLRPKKVEVSAENCPCHHCIEDCGTVICSAVRSMVQLRSDG
jgi:hypothetical protein